MNVNAKGGSLRVELIDSQGNPISGYAMSDCISIQSDDVAQMVEWKNHTKLPIELNEFRIRFEMNNVSLYGFYAGSDVIRKED